jgi:uncharacterized membrane protein
MTWFCILLIACSALMHAGWNLICKSQNPSGAFFLVATGASIGAMLPVTIYFLPIMRYLPQAVWILLLITGIVQAAYYICLGNAYRLGEISVAYPLAKAMPVLFVPAVTMALSLGNQLNGAALIGMLLVSLGCVILPMPSFRAISPRNYLKNGFIFILGAALATTAYTIIDSEALRIFRRAGVAGYIQTAVIYIAWENILIELFLALYMLFNKEERQMLRKMIHDGSLHYPAISGVICTASYTLVLLAMMLASNVSYIAAFRQLSIPLGAVMGIILFKESSTSPKVAGIALIFIGLLVIGLFK